MTEARHLAESALYAEDRFCRGHTSVWGSYFNVEKKSWGYACCRQLQKEETCSLAAPGAELEASSTIPEPDEAERKLRLGELPREATEPQRSPTSNAEEYLSHFISFWFHEWAAKEGTPHGASASTSKAEQSTREALLPLMLQLRQRALPFLQQLVRFAELASEREYAQANDVYIGITIGKALWHSHLDLGEQRAHWGQGCNLRTMQKQVVEKDHKNATLFDTNPAVQRYVHALKRLVTFMQTSRPSQDPSKMGHVPAPAPRGDDVGLPVIKGIRDSDGRGREPEFMEPPEAYALATDKGLAFGAESGRAHPFHGIGNARG
eukprot:CAMPEP_0178394470 /NCGR_PEP_ID=MMETSP0689_2-20121128/12722_1 /TAXON_ID=160604 /ORGANISM="Amphidinium massartii, Strain CS-259" /LENGTH=320 /DNA_ID=CAMNT_0020015099 /DNA_START=79 /DNA_END=1037 /DNA_ORIENTATION=+